MRTVLLSMLVVFCVNAHGQTHGLYPPGTRWYQDPLGLKPIELSSAAGFFWGTTAAIACILATSADSGFRKRIYLYDDAGAGVGYKSPFTLMLQNNAGFMYRLREWMSVGMELSVFSFRDDTMKAASLGIRPFARWYVLYKTDVNIFFEYGAGVSYSDRRFPGAGTRFNFTPRYGFGAEVKVSHRLKVQLGARHSHLSNGNIKGIRRNPSHDSNGMFAGVMYQLW